MEDLVADWYKNIRHDETAGIVLSISELEYCGKISVTILSILEISLARC